jgi:uncharacterized membrane protein YeaQ/YmgE (transglycosylase-associated protein family)
MEKQIKEIIAGKIKGISGKFSLEKTVGGAVLGIAIGGIGSYVTGMPLNYALYFTAGAVACCSLTNNLTP